MMNREPARESLLREMRGALTVAHAMAQRGRADLARQWEKLAADYLERAIQQHYETIH